MINPSKILQLKSAWERFSSNHPKFIKFISAMGKNTMVEGTVIEVTVTTPNGESTSSNLKLTAGDLELFREISNII